MKKILMIKRKYIGGGKLYIRQAEFLAGTARIGIYLVTILASWFLKMCLVGGEKMAVTFPLFNQTP